MPYTKKIWRRNEIITEDGLNHIETGIEANDTAIKKLLQRDIVEANIQKVGPTETSRAEIIQKENGSSLNLIISKDVDENIIQTEEGRVRAEEKRVEAEQSRVLAEAERKKSETARVLSENKRQQETSTAIGNANKATSAAVAKAQTATDNATTAANKAESAVAKLPLPLGNTLKGEVEATLVNVDDAYPAPLVTTKVLGQSNQLTTTGRNLVNHAVPLNAEGDGPFRGEKLNNGFVIESTVDDSQKRIATMNVLGGIKAGDTIIVSCNYKKLSGDIKSPSIYLSDEPQEYGIAINKPYIVKNNHSLVGVYLNEGTNSEMKITDVQLIKGSTPTAYEPYTGGKPSPSPDYPQEITNLNKAELVVAGKNLADVNESNNVNFTLRREPLPAGTYTFSCDKGKDSGFFFNIKKLDDSGTPTHEITTSKTSPCTFTISEPTALFINGWGLYSPFVIGSIQLEAGSTATAYEPRRQTESTAIDLKGNELCSVTENKIHDPNTFKDELVIDSEGNVSLIKRVFSAHIDGLEPMSLGAVSTYQYFSYTPKTVRPIDGSDAICSNRFGEIGREPWKFYVAGGSNAALFFTFPLETFTNDGELNEWLKSNPIDVNYLGAESQTIPLGKVELPALPESTSNVWNNGNIPANVYINYLKDVNIAYGKLESQLNQMAMALSVMDTPTIIPEISEDEPTLITELKESPNEESSI